MKTIATALAANHVVGDRIRLPWDRLDRKLKLHTKELAIVAGAPGSGKSVFALNLAMSNELSEEPVLYLAQDSMPSVLTRIAALALSESIDTTQARLRNPETKPDVLSELQGVRPNLFIQGGALTVEGIRMRMEALTEVYGKAPTLVIIDNLIDTEVPGFHHQEVGFYASILNELKQLALESNTCVMALHHVTKGGKDSPHGLGTRAMKMTDLLYSGERESEHVIGVYHSTTQDRIFVQVLKQRDGEADPEGGVYVPLVWQPTMGRLERRG